MTKSKGNSLTLLKPYVSFSKQEKTGMEKAGNIEFKCIEKDCQGIISFSMLDIEKAPNVRCPVCANEYTFNANLIEKIRKFAHLIYTVKESEDILGNTHIAINVEGHSINIPYRLLLTRLNTMLTLKIGDSEAAFKFRVEPLKEIEI